MLIHHISCGTFCPPARQLVNGQGGLFKSGRLTCHCLVIENGDGVILVDTGLGLADLEHPALRISPAWSAVMRPEADPEQSAVRQLEALGYYFDDVTDIVLTHLDFDHAGGLPDFPQARVHVFEDEFQAAMSPKTSLERFRYKAAQWEHSPEWVRYRVEGEKWFGFESVRALGDANATILLIPLPGHTRGHCGVAVETEGGWLLHAGDAYFCHNEIESASRRCPPLTKGYERLMQTSGKSRITNQRRLHELHQAHGMEVEIICSHDPTEFIERAEAPTLLPGSQAPRF